MSKIKFEMRPVEKKREKTYLKGSKYDPIIDQFIAGGEELVEITVEDRKASYVVTQLNKRIERRGLDFVASWAEDAVYLERKPEGAATP